MSTPSERSLLAHPRRAEIDERIRAGESFAQIIADLDLDCHRQTLSEYARQYLQVTRGMGYHPPRQASVSAPLKPTCPGATAVAGMLYCEAGCPYYGRRLGTCAVWGQCGTKRRPCLFVAECLCMSAELRGRQWQADFEAWARRWGKVKVAVVPYGASAGLAGPRKGGE